MMPGPTNTRYRKEAAMADQSLEAGAWIIVPTPFSSASGEPVDLDSLGRVIRFMAELGVAGVTVAGVLGEGAKLTESERDAIVERAVVEGAGLPVCVGSNAGAPAIVTERLHRARERGAVATLLSPTSAPGLADQHIFELFERASAAELPIVVQDHPESSGVNMGVPLLVRLVNELPEVAGIKEEVRNTGPKISALRDAMTERAVPILAGLGAVNGANDLARGADGFMTGVAVPEILLAMLRHRDDPSALAALERRYLPLLQLEDRLGLAARKWIYAARGLLADPALRSPGAAVDDHTVQELRAKLEATFPGQDLTRPLEISV